MFELEPSTLLVIAMGISFVLFFALALFKRYAYYWWGIGGIIICLPIAIVSRSIGKAIDKKLSTELIFIMIYFIIYFLLWILLKPSVITEEERRKQEKLDEAIFDGFMALKEKKINDAYSIFKKAYLVDPDNPVIKKILASFQQGQHGLIKKKSFSEWRFKFIFSLKSKKRNTESNNSNEKVEKKVNGKVVE